MIRHLDTLSALRALAEGRIIPRSKYAALQRAALIRVRGHGPRSLPELTDAGLRRLNSISGSPTARTS